MITMLWQNCEQKTATTHISGWKLVGPSRAGEERKLYYDYHFCEDCAAQLRQTDPLLNPSPGARRHALRVTRVKPDRVTVKELGAGAGAQEWDFVIGQSASQYVPGDEFELTCDEAEFDALRSRQE